ncbi:hypothetical protein N0V91_007288 [Didymella pomorum]|uniref:Extracellular membrane protein CFEM domain-containing protein n=1 Tax=Didymella pomorum TaxID=749634 RepID=A0A9W8Z984_9PLEO|nr:hypothetical protein N0V91_007288 [Didymella pomorum]
MLFQKLTIIAALTAIVAAQDISQDDIPSQCFQICAQVVTIARDCDTQHDNDAAELQCICSAANASTLLPNCEACVAQYDTDTDDDDNNNDNDVREVLTRCNFSVQSSFNSASASSVASSIASASAATTASSVVVTRTSGTSVVTSTLAPNQVSQAGAPAITAAAGMGIGALGFALGML